MARWPTVARRSSGELLLACSGGREAPVCPFGWVELWMLRSTDGSNTWSAHYRVPVNSPHGPIPLSDGRLLYPGKQFGHGEGRIGACESADDGQSWRGAGAIPVRPGDIQHNYQELHGVEADGGTLIIQMKLASSTRAVLR